MSFQKPIRKTKPALYMLINTPTFKMQRQKLRPEHSKAGGFKVRSEPEAVRMAVYSGVKSLFMAKNPTCSCHRAIHGGWVPVVATEIHHTKGREGWLLIDVRHWKSVCADCHRWIHEHPAEARELGLIAGKGEWNKKEEA